MLRREMYDKLLKEDRVKFTLGSRIEHNKE